jgi:hypothetical protein
MTVREAHSQALTLDAAAMAAGHIGGGPGFVDEDEALLVQIALAIEPFLALFQDVGAVLLDGVPSSACLSTNAICALLNFDLFIASYVQWPTNPKLEFSSSNRSRKQAAGHRKNLIQTGRRKWEDVSNGNAGSNMLAISTARLVGACHFFAGLASGFRLYEIVNRWCLL